MPKRRSKPAAERRVTPTIARGNVPVPPKSASTGEECENLDPKPPTPPDPESEERLVARGSLMALLYAECGSYVKVAEYFNVQPGTVRWWVHQMRKRSTEKLMEVASRLQNDVRQLAVDRIVEGLTEGDTEFAAELGRKLLHGYGDLRSHSSVKNDGPAAVMNLTVNIAKPDRDVGDVIDGAVLGQPRQLGAPESAQTAAED